MPENLRKHVGDGNLVANGPVVSYAVLTPRTSGLSAIFAAGERPAK